MLNTLPYLQPGELAKMIEIIKQNCENDMSVEQLQWLVLFNALADRNIQVTHQTTKEMLATDDTLRIDQLRFLLSAYILCSVLLDEHNSALLTWEQHVKRLYQGSNIPFEMLLIRSLIKTGS